MSDNADVKGFDTIPVSLSSCQTIVQYNSSSKESSDRLIIALILHAASAVAASLKLTETHGNISGFIRIMTIEEGSCKTVL